MSYKCRVYVDQRLNEISREHLRKRLVLVTETSCKGNMCMIQYLGNSFCSRKNCQHEVLVSVLQFSSFQPSACTDPELDLYSKNFKPESALQVQQ